MPSATSPKTALTITPRDWLLLALLGVVWGGSYFFAKVAVEDIGPLTVVFGRVALAAIILTVAMRVRGIPFPTNRAAWEPFFVMGAINSAIPYTLIFWGETRISSGLAAILTALVPMFTVIVAHFGTSDERISPAKLAGIVVGLAGVVVILGDDAGDLSGSLVAKLAIIAAAVSYAFSGVYGKRLKGTAPVVLAWGQMCAASVLILPLVVFVDRPWDTAAWHLDAVLSVIALAVFSTALAYMIFFRLLANIGATNTSLVTFLIPVSSLLLGFVFLDETFGPLQMLGMLLIATGMLTIDGRLLHHIPWRSQRLAHRPAD
ncbi:MAG TPA: EamA family transporter [Thermomicrobiales bacterium]|nr:EamA family transporter [Thermomicrobiales bacterium]